MSDFAIHAVTVGGGILAICPIPGCDGAFEADMAHIHDWQPSIVLSMVTDEELQAAGRPALGADFIAMGARWIHMPVVDFDVPDQEQNRHWAEIAPPVLSALGGGGRVLVHCRGGCGRSGMIALRLMIEAGEDRAVALDHLRAVRPCAVETPAQMEWATGRA